jgi:choline-sulfatase
MTHSPDVLFVVLDSARKDRLSTYGHDRETTPSLSALSETATTYEQAYTPAPWTLPSHCSLFTGRYPTEHGVTNGFTDAMARLPTALPTLAERLSEQGYRTAGFSNNPWVGQLSGLDRGFDEFVEWDLEVSRRGGADIHSRRDDLYDRGHALLGLAARTPVHLLKRRFFTDSLVTRASRWVDGPPTPTFTFLNLMEAHSPYYPPRRAFRQLGLTPPGPVEARKLNLQLTAYVLGKASVDDVYDRVMEFYDASVRFQDQQFGELLAALKAAGRFDDALIVVCADHGKTLGEYDRGATPPHYLRKINTNVPLLVKYPGQTTAERVETPVELTQLFELLVGDREPSTLVDPDAPGALVEDHIPHTGREATAVTRWRAFATEAGTFAQNEAGDEFLIDTTEPDDAATRRRYRDWLDARVSQLETAEWGEEERAVVDGNVASQLEDLGYLN